MARYPGALAGEGEKFRPNGELDGEDHGCRAVTGGYAASAAHARLADTKRREPVALVSTGCPGAWGGQIAVVVFR